MSLILASSSPRRQELLAQIGVPFEVKPAAIDERIMANEDAPTYVRRVAKEKALAISQQHPQQWILAADTVVLLDHTILTKPQDVTAAKQMLEALSGRTHQVLTAVVLARGMSCEQILVNTAVSFITLSAAQINAYVATGEPMDKAGAYGIQAKAAVFVEKIQGSYTNVVGLPLTETAQLLQKNNIPIWQS